MFTTYSMSAPLNPKNLPENPTPDDILNAFLEYLVNTDTQPYDHQEEAILELFQDKNAILNTPTGSGKSLVAQAMQFKLLCQDRSPVYLVHFTQNDCADTVRALFKNRLHVSCGYATILP